MADRESPARVGPVHHFSESFFTVKGHGVHTAVIELPPAQRGLGLRVDVNTLVRDGILHLHTVGPVSVLRSAVHRGPRVATAHVTIGSLRGSIRGTTFLGPLMTRYIAWFYNRMDAVIALGHDSVRELRSMGVHAPVTVGSNGIDLRAFQPSADVRAVQRARLGLQDNDLVVLCVGQLQPRKGVSAFIECAGAIPSATFIWVGDILFGVASEQRGHMRRLVKEAPPNVRFVGQLERGLLPGFYAAADVFMLASRHETFGLAALEAAASGLPLLLSDLAVFREVFGHVDGAFIAHESVPAYVSSIRKLADDPHLRADLGARARQASGKYSAVDMARRSSATYLLAAKNHAKRASSRSRT